MASAGCAPHCTPAMTDILPMPGCRVEQVTPEAPNALSYYCTRTETWHLRTNMRQAVERWRYAAQARVRGCLAVFTTSRAGLVRHRNQVRPPLSN